MEEGQAELLATLALSLATPLAVFVPSAKPLQPNGLSLDNRLANFRGLQR